jgi:TATA-box binding protein (TBP) (component of TFIID and TFIIIB)
MNNIPNPGKLRISTITAIGDFGLLINLEKLAVNLASSIDEEDSTIMTIKYRRGGNKKSKDNNKPDILWPINDWNLIYHKSKLNGSKKMTSTFFNQITTEIILKSQDTKQKKIKTVNMKIFTNGKIQITGIRRTNLDDAKFASNVIYNMIKKDISIIDVKNSPSQSIEDIKTNNFYIALINSDYDAGFKIIREPLSDILNDMCIFTTYEPTIYPGVKARVYINDINDTVDGLCHCTEKGAVKVCPQKGGCGSGIGECHSVTISVFQSGKIIITGGITISQIDKCYAFINKILKDNFSIVRRKQIIEIPENKNNKIYIDKSTLNKYNKTINIKKLIVNDN